MNLDKMPISELVALHNQHAPAPVRKFKDKPTAIRRVKAVLPAATPKERGQRMAELMSDRKPHALPDLAATLGCTVKEARAALGVCQRMGFPTTAHGQMRFSLGRNIGQRAHATPPAMGDK